MRGLLRRRLAAFGESVPTPFSVSFADGSRIDNRQGEPEFHIRFRSTGAEWRTVAFGYVGLMDSYFDGDIEIDGNLNAMYRVGMAHGFDTPNPLVSVRNHWHELTKSNATWARAKANARFHYGLGAAFYRLWLDSPYMMYTCGYWPEGVRTLEEAQIAKMEHVCRKIRLAPGESVVDIGCGFGGFMRYAANRYGAVVTGVNTTTEQVESVQADIAHWTELHHKMPAARAPKVIETDFRDVFATFDKVVSIGVLEHAGRDQIDEVVKAHADFLNPGGLGMLHFIGHIGAAETEFFIRNHVFPGGWIPGLSEVIESIERHGLEVVDIENLRRHYALTLDEWTRRFDANWPTIRALDPARFDERFRRIWRTYLIACAEMFRSPCDRTHLFQITFSKGNITRENYPMSREFLYTRATQPANV